jgi:hypothetical protein
MLTTLDSESTISALLPFSSVKEPLHRPPVQETLHRPLHCSPHACATQKILILAIILQYLLVTFFPRPFCGDFPPFFFGELLFVAGFTVVTMTSPADSALDLASDSGSADSASDSADPAPDSGSADSASDSADPAPDSGSADSGFSERPFFAFLLDCPKL